MTDKTATTEPDDLTQCLFMRTDDPRNTLVLKQVEDADERIDDMVFRLLSR